MPGSTFADSCPLLDSVTSYKVDINAINWEGEFCTIYLPYLTPHYPTIYGKVSFSCSGFIMVLTTSSGKQAPWKVIHRSIKLDRYNGQHDELSGWKQKIVQLFIFLGWRPMLSHSATKLAITLEPNTVTAQSGWILHCIYEEQSRFQEGNSSWPRPYQHVIWFVIHWISAWAFELHCISEMPPSWSPKQKILARGLINQAVSFDFCHISLQIGPVNVLPFSKLHVVRNEMTWSHHGLHEKPHSASRVFLLCLIWSLIGHA